MLTLARKGGGENGRRAGLHFASRNALLRGDGTGEYSGANMVRLMLTSMLNG